jgi:hypothetical protein
MLYNKSDIRRLQQNISKSGIPFYVVVVCFVHLRPLYHIYRTDSTIKTYQLLHNILVKTNGLVYSTPVIFKQKRWMWKEICLLKLSPGDDIRDNQVLSARQGHAVVKSRYNLF